MKHGIHIDKRNPEAPLFRFRTMSDDSRRVDSRQVVEFKLIATNPIFNSIHFLSKRYIQLIMDQIKVHELENRLGHTFNDKSHLIRALTHPTFTNVQKQKYDRDCPHQGIYATLGDAILKAVLVSLLMDIGLENKEKITSKKERLENNSKLADIAKRIRLLEDDYILHALGTEEKVREGMLTVCSDTFEALIGAIFIDSDYAFHTTKDCISMLFAPELQEIKSEM